MGNKKMKEDEKIEKTIRALLKLPENKRCINCNLLGPQYVCTTFLTFVCTTCCGIHREFSHRVKSVSMAKFTEEEVTALQAAGNERARQIYFKAWDPQRHSFPDASNPHKLREFIKHVYVDRKYTGERSDRLLNLRPSTQGNRGDSSESRKLTAFSGRAKSPLFEDRHEMSSNDGSSPARRKDSFRGFYNETRSPRYAQENIRYGGSRRNPVFIEIVDNRRRYDSPGSATNQDYHSDSPRESVRPVRDNMGDNTPASQKGEHSKENAGKDPDGSARNQNTSQKIASFRGMESLIDFSMDSELSNAVAAPNTQQVHPLGDDGNQSSDELSSKGKAPPASSANSLESLFFGLSVPSVAADNVSAIPGTSGVPSTVSGQNISLDIVPHAAPTEQQSPLTSADRSSTATPDKDVAQKHSYVEPLQATHDINYGSMVKAPDEHAFPTVQKHQSSLFSASDNSFSAQQSTGTVEAFNNQSSTSLLMHNDGQSSNVSTKQSSQANSKSTDGTGLEVEVQPLSAVTKSSQRRELPEDLFTAGYASAPAAVQSWQNGPTHATGSGFQYYPNAVQAVAFPSTARANPFDLNNDTTPVQASQFPSMASWLGSLPSVQGHSGFSQTPIFNATSHPSYLASMMTPSSTSATTSSIPSSANMADQSHIIPSSRPQGIGSLGSNEFTLDSLSTFHRPTVGHSASNSPNSFPKTSANPFG